MKRDTPLKDGYDGVYIERLAAGIAAAWKPLDRAAFAAAVFAEGWDELELKSRMLRIAEAIDGALPGDLAAALAILDPVVPGFDGYHAMFFPTFVELRVMRDIERCWESAFHALARYTPHSSSEFAVRPLIVADQEGAMAELLAWTRDADHHVRRLASEGCRPRLPWAMALPALKRDPAPVLPILEALRDDESEYVRRSVANNLNDIAKDHPQLVLEVAARWLGDGSCAPDRKRLVKHACRTLLKAGESRAMKLFGFRDPADIVIRALELERRTVAIGDELEFRFRIEGPPSLGLLRLEYAVHYRKANGSLSPKVFKISEFESDEPTREVIRRHAFRELSTRRLHAGPHELELRINGVEKARARFELVG